MKTTLDIPDALYRQFKIKAATNGETIRNATITFITAYVNGRANGIDSDGVPNPDDERQTMAPPPWAGLAAPYIHEHLDGPHDMETIRRVIGQKRKAERRS